MNYITTEGDHPVGIQALLESLASVAAEAVAAVGEEE